MTTVAAIEAAIERLPRRDQTRLSAWLAERDAQLWDRQMEEDAAAGRLDAVFAKAEKEIAAGKTRPLRELLDHR
ncbi:MAG: hypothetical protein KJ749_10270 [Planctomycetes bacterium]|nr:hypothetical protein [Planctomycetota bacterium]